MLWAVLYQHLLERVQQWHVVDAWQNLLKAVGKAEADRHAAPPQAADADEGNPVALIAKNAHKGNEDGLHSNAPVSKQDGTDVLPDSHVSLSAADFQRGKEVWSDEQRVLDVPPEQERGTLLAVPAGMAGP